MGNGPSSASLDFQAFIERERQAVEATLQRLAVRDLVELPPGIRAPVRYALEAGGKRLRPILCVAAFEAATKPHGSPGKNPAAVYEIGCAVEWVHTYSLVHDDLPCMDDDDLRRGRPSTHLVFGSRSAMVAGFGLILEACRLLDQAGRALGLLPLERMVLVKELCAGAGAQGMVAGQVRDLEAESRPALGLRALEQVHKLKTGALIVASLRLGGIAARAGQTVLDALTRYGLGLGLAFQIIDDVLDVTGQEARLGKPAGSDDAMGKATFPALLGIDGARQRAETEVAEALDALVAAGLASPEFEGLARFAVGRDH